ncbi:hypothetical protein RUM43_006972 [Polyplax serrata]|uniref:protein-tyrosine-phosphatase n=1 Tax=Polyplax serrata TaxID=468196 RepID=A0AAN8P802_POLSC
MPPLKPPLPDFQVLEGTCLVFRLSKGSLLSSSRRGSLFRRMNSAPSGSLSDSSSENCETGHDGNCKNSKVLVVFNGVKNSTSSSPMKQDSDSRDSGCAVDDSSFRFAEPCGFAPKKTIGDSPNPSTEGCNESALCKMSGRKTESKSSFGSGSSFDDGFLDAWDLEKSFTDENEELPFGLGNLLKGPLLGTNGICSDDEKSGVVRPPLRRFNSLMDNYSSPASSKARVGLFRDDLLSDESPRCDKLAFKRPREIDTNSAKRRKSSSLQTIWEKSVKETSNSRYKLQRSISETAASSLSSMLHKSDLIADFTRPYALPVVSGRHEDLKSITSDTLAGLLNGEFKNKVDSFKIIDCRYPYEYEGGHIKGSINLYTKEHVEQELFTSKITQESDSTGGESRNDKRNILIFHCEFSLERGPTLYRFLRRCDRNLSSYPSLHYPEVYLLHGGYESFFSTHKSLCEPCSYQPMVDPKHENDLRKFRIKSNSWSGDLKRQASRSGLKRLGLFN